MARTALSIALCLAWISPRVAQAAGDLAQLRVLLEQERAPAAEAAALAEWKTLATQASPPAEALELIGRALTLSGHPAALEVLTRAVAEHPRSASAHFLLGAEYELRRQSGRALEAYEAALKLAEAQTGSASPSVRARTLAGRGRLLTGLARYDEARQVLAQASELSPDDAEVRLALAQLVYVRNDLAGAEKILAETTGSGLARSRVLLARAGLALERGRFREAEAGLRAGIAQLEQLLGPTNRQLLPALRNLARCLHSSGDLSASVAVIERAITISSASFGADGAATAQLMGTLATAKAESGLFAEALTLYHRILDVEIRSLGPDHPQVAADLFSLANLEQVLGDFAGSIGHARRSLAIREAAEGRQSARTASIYALLGRVHALNGDLVQGRELTRLAVGIGRRTVGAAHPRTVFALSDLGEVLILSGQPEEAARVLAESHAGMEKLFGADSVRTAQGSYNLGLAHRAAGRHQQALDWFQRAARIWRGAFGDQYPLLAEAQAGVAASLVELGRSTEALEPALASAAIRRESQTAVALTAAEREALLYARVDRDGLELALDLAAEGRLDQAGATRVWDALIADRAAVLDAMARRRRLARASPSAPALLDDVARLKKDLAQAALLGEPRHYAARVAELRERLAAAERRLAAIVPGLEGDDAGPTPDLNRVARALPANTALVAYARTPRRYVAFVLGPASPRPWAVDLGGAAAVEALIQSWRKQLDVERSSRGRNARRNEAAIRSAGLQLRRTVWDPVKPRISGALAVWVVADGALHTVSLEALPQGQNRYLIETEPPFTLLTAERDLAHPLPSQTNLGRLLALGDPAVAPEASAAAARCAPAVGPTLGRLPSAALEVSDIEAFWRASGGTATSLTGDRAEEGILKKTVPGARVLHVAAHGFYLEPACRLPNEPALAANPLLRSGLALAATPRSNAEDGLLTAEEISGLNLDGLQLAVLSGCETALGDHQAGEGLLGLRRAFRAAGATWMVASLWAVEDTAARFWMRSFYRALLRSALPPSHAARSASLSQLRRLRASGASTHPFYWAAYQAAR